MKQIVKIDVEENDKIITKIFKIDETIFDGFFFTTDEKKVKSNIKKFGIKKQPAKTYNDIGVKYSKEGKCVIVTFNIKQPNMNFYGQFLIGSEVETLDILNCEHPAVKGLEAMLMDGLDLAKVQTLEDFVKLKRFA
tara:strand:- start:3518 stop:3925 length:408 start_codon:yes stop_codon:yes gene_type:complete